MATQSGLEARIGGNSQALCPVTGDNAEQNFGMTLKIDFKMKIWPALRQVQGYEIQ